MIIVMMTLVRWDDRGEEMNQEEADQDVADEVSEEAVYSHTEYTHRHQNFPSLAAHDSISRAVELINA